MPLSSEGSKAGLAALFTSEEGKKPKEGEILPSGAFAAEAAARGSLAKFPPGLGAEASADPSARALTHAALLLRKAPG